MKRFTTHLSCLALDSRGRIVGALAIFILAAAATVNFTLNHFYVNGGAMLDSGWFAYLSANVLEFPPPNPGFLGGTYFSTHLSPIFYLFSAGYHALDSLGLKMPNVVWFSLTQGIWPALASSSVFMLLSRRPITSITGWISIAAVSILLGFNGAILSSIGFPHFEMAIPALLLAFFSNYIGGKYKTAICLIFIGLLTREDAGLHYFGLFSVLAIFLAYYDGRASGKHARYFAALAAGCAVFSVSAVIFQKTFFSFDDNAMMRVYSGDPAFSHLTASFLIDRLSRVAVTRLYILAPLAVIVIYAVKTRCWILLVGVVAVLPWIIFNLLAISIHAGNLSVHYSFPIAIAIFWPAIIYGWAYSGELNHSFRSGFTLYGLFAIALSSVAFIWQIQGFNQSHSATDFFPKWIGNVESSHAGLHEFLRHNGDLNLAFDDATASLLNTEMSSSQWKFMLSFTDEELAKIDAVVYQPGAWLSARVQEVAEVTGLRYKCLLPNTRFVALSRLDGLKKCSAPEI